MAPRPLKPRVIPDASAFKVRGSTPVTEAPVAQAAPVQPKPAGGKATAKPAPPTTAAAPTALAAKGKKSAAAPTPPPAPISSAMPAEAWQVPVDGRDRTPESLERELGETLAQIEELESAPYVWRPRPRAEGQGRLSWIWAGVKDSLRRNRNIARRLAGWWRHWRTTASFRVVVGFVVIYTLLALVRAPSELVVEQSRRTEEIAFLQQFLREYRAAGGVVLAQKPHGGTELYPRGVVLKGELLAAFQRAPVGEVFAVHTTSPESNLLSGFYGFPSIYLGGEYFHLERKFNFALYRCSYLIRKDSEQSGVILTARVEPAQ